MGNALKFANTPAKVIPTHSRLDFHTGEALCRVAAEYPTVFDVILEQVQNAIDANATSISVVLNRKTRHIAIRDDGDGVSAEAFDEALQRVCLSGKEQGKLGRFGIGLISPLDKCHSFTFTSSPRGSMGKYMEWTFVTDAIRMQSKDVTVPTRKRDDLFFVKAKDKVAPKTHQGVMWRTEVNIVRYTVDKMISRIVSIESLSDAILERFSAPMRKHNIVLNLKFVNENGSIDVLEGVKAKLFTGKPLKEITLQDEDAGKVRFKIFLTRKTTKGKVGKVSVGEMDNDYRFGFNLFARTAEGFLSDEIISGLCSGIFEGEILGENIKLHSTRRSFEKNDAFVGFCTSIEAWFKEHGYHYLDDAKEARRDERYQELGMQSLREIEMMLQDPTFSDIRSVLSSFKLGTVGTGHAPRSKDKVVGVQEERALSILLADKSENSDSESGERESSVNEKPDHQPYTVAGPRGQQRTLVKRDSVGLQFSYIAIDGSDRLWELDTRQGVLHFNVNHPIWVACDVSDRKIRQLQETVAIYALMLEAMPDDLKESMRYAYDETLRPLTFLYHSSPSFNLRKRSASTNEK